MTELLSRRKVLSGLIAAPAVVSFASLMPVRGIIMPAEPIIPFFAMPDISGLLVDTASAENLDRMAALWGVSRHLGETDNHLRARAIEVIIR